MNVAGYGNTDHVPCSRPGHRYSIDVDTVNAGIPYADSFSVACHYCMSSSSDGETSLAGELKFKKNVWAVMKGLIEKNCWAGMEDYFCSLTKALSIEFEETGGGVGLKGKKKAKKKTSRS